MFRTNVQDAVQKTLTAAFCGQRHLTGLIVEDLVASSTLPLTRTRLFPASVVAGGSGCLWMSVDAPSNSRHSCLLW